MVKALSRIQATYPDQLVAWACPILQNETTIVDVIGWHNKGESTEDMASDIKRYLVEYPNATQRIGLYALQSSRLLDGDTESLAIVLARFALYQIFVDRALESVTQS